MVPDWFFMVPCRFLLVFRGLSWFQGGFMFFFYVFWLVSMVFQVGFMVFHGFWLVSMVFHGFWLVSMNFQGGFMVFHGFWLVSMGF